MIEVTGILVICLLLGLLDFVLYMDDGGEDISFWKQFIISVVVSIAVCLFICGRSWG